MVFGLWHHPQFMQAVQNHIDSRASTEEGNGQLGHIEQGRIEHRQLPCLVKDSEPDREVGKGFAKRLDKAASVLICAHKRRRIICKMNKIAITRNRRDVEPLFFVTRHRDALLFLHLSLHVSVQAQEGCIAALVFEVLMGGVGPNHLPPRSFWQTNCDEKLRLPCINAAIRRAIWLSGWIRESILPQS
jgi:hypothetical protein